MVWNVRLFAYLKDRLGPSVEVEAAPSAEALLAALRAKGLPTESCRLAVNHEFAEADTRLDPGDELALIPPVSGG